MLRSILALVLALGSVSVLAEEPPPDVELQQSVEQLRTSIGECAVTTEFLDSDGSVSRAVEGTYESSWGVPDQVVSGRSAIPDLDQVSGLLFYINEKKREIEMVSVGRDGRLWIMTGPLGRETRTTPEFATADGGTGKLRSTRYDVGADSFESKMEYSSDGGKTWIPGNHQTFRRPK